LISNAIKFSPVFSTITITLAHISERSSLNEIKYEISVQDRGIGM